MEEAAGKNVMTKFSISDMEKELQEAMRQNAGSREVKPLRECSRGVVVEEMVDHDGELRVLVLHGSVQVAATDSGVSNISEVLPHFEFKYYFIKSYLAKTYHLGIGMVVNLLEIFDTLAQTAGLRCGETKMGTGNSLKKGFKCQGLQERWTEVESWWRECIFYQWQTFLFLRSLQATIGKACLNKLIFHQTAH